jgi:hypothetical protein
MRWCRLFKNIGLILATLTFIIGGYEGLALVTPLPTISRMVQGLRDSGHPLVVFLISTVLVWILASFGAWLYYHLNYQLRSGN